MHCGVRDKAATSSEWTATPRFPSLGWAHTPRVHTRVEGSEGALRVSR